MVLVLPAVTSFALILFVLFTGFKIVNLLFPMQKSEPRK